MKILNFYKMNEEKKDENIDFPIFENDKEVLFNFIDSVYKVISDKILDEKKESDLSKAAYSKSEKYKRYRKILKRIKDKIEDCVLDESEKISLTFFEYNFLYYSLLYEYENIMQRINKEGVDIIDEDIALKINYFEHQQNEIVNNVKKIESELYPFDEKFNNQIEESLWLIDNDGFPENDMINTENDFLDIIIADYEKCTIIENLIFFKELIDTKPSDKVYHALRFYIDEKTKIIISKETQIKFIDKIIQCIEHSKQGDVILKISSSEFFLYYTLCNAFYERLIKKFQTNYTCNYSLQQQILLATVKDVRLYFPYNQEIFNIYDRKFNRYFN